MRVAAVEFSYSMLDAIESREQYLDMMQGYIARAVDNEVDLLVFPGFTGCYYQLMEFKGQNLHQTVTGVCHQQFIHSVMELSKEYELLICPGSYWERQGEDVFHASCLLQSGEILLKQRQLYLAKWEKELSLSRGTDVEVIEVKGWKTGIMLATDVFYPQVARRLALMGTDIVVSPVGFVGDRNACLQVSGVWQKAQLNHLFVVESAFNGILGKKEPEQDSGDYADKFNDGPGHRMLWGESIIHAPLPMTPHEDGILQRTYGNKDFVMADLDLQKRSQALKEFNALVQLNPGFYEKIRCLGGKKAADS